MVAWYFSLLSIPVARMSFIWTCEICGDQVKCSSEGTLRYFTEVMANSLFLSSLILKELFFSDSEKFYLLLATLKVFSDHNSFSLLMFSANCQTELCWYHLQGDMTWSILDMRGDH